MVAGYKVNIQWSFVFLLIYSSNEQTKIEIKKIAPKKLICKNKLTKAMQDMYTENYRTLLKEIKEGLNKWRHSMLMNEKT